MSILNKSLVDRERIKRDPRKLSFLRPNLPLRRYTELTDEWYHAQALKAVEDVARINGQLLVPSGCLNKKRRDPQRRVYFFGRTYYLLRESDMTELEILKYQELIN